MVNAEHWLLYSRDTTPVPILGEDKLNIMKGLEEYLEVLSKRAVGGLETVRILQLVFFIHYFSTEEMTGT